MSTRAQLAKRDGIYCRYCGYVPTNKMAGLVADHLWPASKGGADCTANRVLACMECDSFKNNTLPMQERWTRYLKERRAYVRRMKALGIYAKITGNSAADHHLIKHTKICWLSSSTLMAS